MERFGRGYLAGIALLLFAAIIAAATKGDFFASRHSLSAADREAVADAKQAEAMSKWQDESDLVDHTGEGVKPTPTDAYKADPDDLERAREEAADKGPEDKAPE